MIELHPLDRAALDRRADIEVRGARWVDAPEFSLDAIVGHGRWQKDGSRFVPVATDRTGSMWCLWVRDPAVRAPVVLLDSEGRYATVAADLDAVLVSASHGLRDAGSANDPFLIWMTAQHSGQSEAAVRARMVRREAQIQEQFALADKATLAEEAFARGDLAEAAGLAREVFAARGGAVPRFAAIHVRVELARGRVPVGVGVLADSEQVRHWLLLAEVYERGGQPDRARPLRVRADDEGWYGFSRDLDLEDVHAVQQALSDLDDRLHPGWVATLRRQLEALRVVDVDSLRGRLAAADEEDRAEAHGRLGLALVASDPVGAYRHLEAAVMELPHASDLTRRCFEALEAREDDVADP